MASRRKVLTGSNMHIPIGGTLLSKIGYTPDSGEPVIKSRMPAVEAIGSAEWRAVLGKLGDAERSLVARALSMDGDCNSAALARFSSLPAGVRELRVRRAIDSVWTGGRWRGSPQFREGKLVSRAPAIEAEIGELEEAYPRLLSVMGLKEATAEEKLKALKPAELTERQNVFLSLAPPAEGTEPLSRFREWVSGLREHARENLWKSSGPFIVSAASLIHRIRFSPKLDFTTDELRLVKELSGAEMPDLAEMKRASSEGFKNKDQQLLEAIRSAVWSGPRQGLLDSAQACAEYRTLLDFLGVPRRQAAASIRPERGICKGSLNLEGNHSTNDDSYTSLDLTIGQRAVRVDAVFDGMSGYNGGYVASGMAKEILEISALAGWIASPEDVREAAVLADLMIHLEKKRLNLKKMATTATISFLEGRELYSIHCGDSLNKLVCGDEILYATIPHGIGNRLWSGLGMSASMITINAAGDSKYQPIKVPPGSWVMLYTDGAGDVVCDHELPMLLKKATSPRKAANALYSLADSRRNREKDYPPLCGCKPLQGKDDDIAIIAVFVE